MHLFYTFLHNNSEGMFLCLPQQLLRVEWGTVYFLGLFLCPSCSQWLSVHESIILGELEDKKCKVHGPIHYQKLRVDGKLTQCMTRDRVVFVDLPNLPLPRFMRFHTFGARVFHFVQENASQGPVCSNCLQDGHHKSYCTNEKVCRVCRQVQHMHYTCPSTAGSEVARLPSTPSEPAVRRKERNVTAQSQGPGEKRATSLESRFSENKQYDDDFIHLTKRPHPHPSCPPSKRLVRV